MRLSVVIPAYNEEHYLPATLDSIHEAAHRIQSLSSSDTVEVIVVDNDSIDQTASIATQQGCHVVVEKVHNIGIVRNTGANAANGDVLVFIDADTIVPSDLFLLIACRMKSPDCIGGAVDVCHMPSKRAIRLYLSFWRLIGRMTRMAQGATQFCRLDVFRSIGGYDQTLFMGEDVDFYWRLRKLGRQTGQSVAYITETRVKPSPRRFDQWPVWKTLLLTNPLLLLCFRKTAQVWSGWYKNRPK